MLLEHSGDLVTREELQKALWPSDTYVDFEHGVNAAVNRLRDVLGDSADKPSLIETLPRRGYRFIAPVNCPVEPLVPDSKIAPKFGSKPSRFLKVTVVAATLAIVLTVGVKFFSPNKSHALTDQDTITVADFSNNSNDPVFDDTLKTAFLVSLQQSPTLSVLSEGEISKTLQMMTRPSNTRLTPEIAREVCQRAGSKAYVAGSISSLGTKYVVGLNAVNCQTGDTLAREQVTATTKENVLDALGRAASNLRQELGESLSSIQKFDLPLSQVTTSSLEALKAYSLGGKALRDRGPAAALSYHQRATELDPNFAMAYWSLGTDYYSLSETDRAAEYLTKAFELRKHTSEREELILAADYHVVVNGELDQAAQVYQEQTENYPLDHRPYNWLGQSLAMLGRYEKAIEAYRQSIRLNPRNMAPYANLSNSLVAMNRFADARQTIEDARARKLEGFNFHVLLYTLASFAADTNGMAEQQEWFTGKPEENLGLSLASDTEAYSGHVHKAWELTIKSVDSAIRADSKESGAVWLENAALREAAFGRIAEGRRAAASGLRMVTTSKSVGVEAALAYAMAGDTDRAESLSRELNKRYPMDTQIQSLWLPAVRAQVSLNRKNPKQALQDLQAGVGTIEFGQIPFVANVSCLYPTYLRGKAFLAIGDATAAASEFQKILDHSGIAWNCWTRALAKLGVARAYVSLARTSQGTQGDSARKHAHAAYDEFFALWKDADSDIPILKEAKAECAKLM
jgi:tetratricopeptide (TPR) repeat protein